MSLIIVTFFLSKSVFNMDSVHWASQFKLPRIQFPRDALFVLFIFFTSLSFLPMGQFTFVLLEFTLFSGFGHGDWGGLQ